MKSTLIFFALFAAAYACTCAPTPTFRKAVLDAKKSKAPFAVVTVVSEKRPNDPFGFEDVIYTVRPQGCKKTVMLITKGTGSLCGVRLQLKTKYVVNLNKDRSPTPINACQSWRPYSSLSAEDKVFVELNVRRRCNKCFRKCPSNTICRKRKCKKIPFCRKKCPYGFICQFGECVSKCLTTICAPGFVCSKGKCIANTISGPCKKPCKPGFFCLVDTCVNECQITLCSPGTRCRQTPTGVECV